eukprot:404250-Pyramimonas_sp.AAC.1
MASACWGFSASSFLSSNWARCCQYANTTGASGTSRMAWLPFFALRRHSIRTPSLSPKCRTGPHWTALGLLREKSLLLSTSGVERVKRCRRNPHLGGWGGGQKGVRKGSGGGQKGVRR